AAEELPARRGRSRDAGGGPAREPPPRAEGVEIEPEVLHRRGQVLALVDGAPAQLGQALRSVGRRHSAPARYRSSRFSTRSSRRHPGASAGGGEITVSGTPAGPSDSAPAVAHDADTARQSRRSSSEETGNSVGFTPLRALTAAVTATAAPPA